jgi:hypothetical protein
MDFFKTDEGVLHGNRIGGTIYLLILLSCGVAREPGHPKANARASHT